MVKLISVGQNWLNFMMKVMYKGATFDTTFTNHSLMLAAPLVLCLKMCFYSLSHLMSGQASNENKFMYENGVSQGIDMDDIFDY